MCPSLALLLALAFPFGQQEDLEIINARGTYGFLGAERPKTGVLAGDALHFAFDIKGIKTDGKGKAEYSLEMEVINEKGEAIFKEGPRNAIAQNFLGGDLLPCAANLEIPPETPPGTYTLKVAIVDLATKKKAVFEAKGKVLAPTFGLVRVGTFADAAGKVACPPVGVNGSSIYVNFSVIHFKREKESKQPDLHLSLRILDDQGKATFPEALTGEVKDNIPPDAKMIPLRFGLTLNRVGQFTVEVTATDKLSGKSAKVTFPLKVTTPK